VERESESFISAAAFENFCAHPSRAVGVSDTLDLDIQQQTSEAARSQRAVLLLHERARRVLNRRCRRIGRAIHRRSSAGIVPRSMIFWMVSSEIRTARPTLT
jgi:hypothetical protein